MQKIKINKKISIFSIQDRDLFTTLLPREVKKLTVYWVAAEGLIFLQPPGTSSDLLAAVSCCLSANKNLTL